MPEPKFPDDPLRELGGARRAYVIPELRLLYISLAKNACTSIKWLMAEAAGEDLDSLRPGTGFFPNRDAGVHDRTAWKKTPRLHQLAPEVRRSISPDNGWMVFSVVRDPRVRLFSAWENKYLLRNPGYWSKMDRPWVPRVPEKPSDVIEDFAMFVHEIGADPEHEALMRPRLSPTGLLRGDAHFRDQCYLLAEHVVPYSRIYDISELGTMMADFNAHVRENGYEGPEFTLGNSNDTPLPANREVFGGGVREVIEKLYHVDFERFGDRWDFSRIEQREMAWTGESFTHVQSIIKANERISDLARAAKRLEQENAKLHEQIKEMGERNKQVRERNARLRERLKAAPGGTASAPSFPRRVLRRLRRS